MYRFKNTMKIKISVLSFLCGMAFICEAAVLPTGEIIMHGNASVIRSDKTMLINSTSKRNVISWDDFSVGKDYSVVIDSNSYLNLVRSSKPSVIDGNVLSTGKGCFYLVNPNGITVGASGSIIASKVVLSTSKLQEQNVSNYLDTGDFEINHNGMGKVGLIGTITSDNIILDGSQLIIRDIANIKRATPVFSGESGSSKDILKLYSSTKRIDVGGALGVDLEAKLGIGAADGLVDHTGQKAISDASEFMEISSGMNESYFITNDINLGNIDAPIGGDRAFTGTIDGAFNSISYTMDVAGGVSDNLGLFSKLENASVSNLKITSSSATVDTPSDGLSVGALSGILTNSKLNNVEVDNYSLSFSNPANAKIYAGALSGAVRGDGTYLENVTAGFSPETEQRLLSKNNYTKGALFGMVNGSVTQKGDVFAKTQNDSIAAVGYNTTDTVFEREYKGVSDSFVYADGAYQNKGFLCPFFIDDDITIEYDKDNPQRYEYSSLVANRYYDPRYYVSVNYDYSTAIEDPATYSHTYSSVPVGTSFYFVKNDPEKGLIAGGQLQHYVTVTEKTVAQSPVDQPPVSQNTSSPSLNFDMIFDYQNSYQLFLSDEKAALALKKNFRKSKNTRQTRSSRLSFYSRSNLVDTLLSPSLLASLNLENNEYQVAKNSDDKDSKKA